MSGWHHGEKAYHHEGNTLRTVSNHYTIPNHNAIDQVAAGTRSRTIVQAHFKALRCYRVFWRFIPFIIHKFALRTKVSEEQAKLQLARHWRHANKVRDPVTIDDMVMRTYEKLGNIKQQDVWNNYVMYMICPQDKDQYSQNEGYSYHDEAKFGKKSEFMQNFYTGGRKNVY